MYNFEWNLHKEMLNIAKHRCSFQEATEVFFDPRVIHLEDPQHSCDEDRFYAVGKTRRGIVVTVRYTWREKTIRIFGAARWRKWQRFYEKNTKSS
jgi:uncharacterized DUF497 family protein